MSALNQKSYVDFCDNCFYITAFVPVVVIDVEDNTWRTEYQCKTCFDDRLDPEDRY